MQYFFAIIFISFLIFMPFAIYSSHIQKVRSELMTKVLNHMNISIELLNELVSDHSAYTSVRHKKTFEKYNAAEYIRNNRNHLDIIKNKLDHRVELIQIVSDFLKENPFTNEKEYSYIKDEFQKYANAEIKYVVLVKYFTPSGRNNGNKYVSFTYETITYLKEHPELYVSKTEIKEIEKAKLEENKKQASDTVINIIDQVNILKGKIIVKKDLFTLDSLIDNLYDKTIASIPKIKVLNGEEWSMINKIISITQQEIKQIEDKNTKLLQYYNSNDFNQIKKTCELLMKSQREFNEYIEHKIKSLSKALGSKVARNETMQDDIYNYDRKYKKTLSSFTKELSSQVFASAENNPIQYLIKNFYLDKTLYKDQICDLKNLLNEIETLKEAKQIIENYKKDYAEYIQNVPKYVLEEDEDGFYSRLGFAFIDENILNVEYKFVYTSNGGKAQRFFTIPMNEETIAELIAQLQNKLSSNSLAKEQRALMTPKIRTMIKERDNYTCCNCGNSSNKEPNLLLEIDHIVPIAKGGLTVEDNLQTLCWKCNRSKGSKLI